MTSEFKQYILHLLVMLLTPAASVRAATYNWTGASGTDFHSPSNWLENSWEQWSHYRFGPSVINGTANFNSGFGTSHIFLDSGLTTNITMGGTQPIIMASGWGQGGVIAIASGSRDLTINTAYNSNGAVTWDVGENRKLTFTNSLSDWNGIASLVKQGAGTAVISGNSTYTGGTTVTGGGTITSGFSGAGYESFTFGLDNGSGTFSGVLADGFSVGSFRKEGNGTQILAGANNYTGTTPVNGGTLLVTGSLHFRPTTNGNSNAVSGNASGTLDFDGTISLDLTSASPAVGNVWNLFHLGSLSGASTLEPVSVTSTTLGAFTETSPGVWQLPVSSARWIFTEGTGSLTYTATDYDTWKNAVAVSGNPTDDDDHDCLTNFAEYAFGLDPKSGGSSGAVLDLTALETGNLTYIRRKAALSGLIFSVWTSADPLEWTKDAGATQSATAIPGTDNESVVVTLSPALPHPGRLFVRISATNR